MSEQNKERANWWLVKAIDTLAEADSLIEKGQTRTGVYNRLYYAVHHVAVALLRLKGDNSKNHAAIIRNFGLKWIKNEKCPKLYGKIIKDLREERKKADYGEFVSTTEKDVRKILKTVENFIKTARKIIPPIPFADIYKIVTNDNKQIRDLSFDFYCPQSYNHHTRLSYWIPKGRLNEKIIKKIVLASKTALSQIGVKNTEEYVLGVNSRVNQYNEELLIMLDFDNISSFNVNALKGEPGFLFRTTNGFHFIGSKLYRFTEWRKRMRKYSKFACKSHYMFSMKRRYATLRVSESSKKQGLPVYIGKIV